MSDLNSTQILSARSEGNELDLVEIKFVLDSVIDFLEELKLQGEALRHAGQLLRDVEDLRQSI